MLTDWIVAAAAEAGFPVQSTSIPGVAQRTGATTYYIEIFPVPARELGGKRPVLALTPGVGDIDIAVASELLEAGRTVANGFVTPDRTHLIASLSRFYAMDEKIAMGDGRFDRDKLIKIIEDNARDALLIDMDALATRKRLDHQRGDARRHRRVGRLPITRRAIRSGDPRRRQVGRQQSARLPRRLAGGARESAAGETAREKENAPTTPELLEHEVSYSLPALAQPTAIEGVRRLIAYQGVRYAQLYLDRLRALIDADAASGAKAGC